VPTKRIPIPRVAAPTITTKAIALFERMRRCKCTCPPDARGHECPGCEKWWSLHSDLVDALGTPVWQWPAIEDPRAENPYPPGTPAHHSWTPDLEAQQMWQALANASRELRRARQAAKAERATPPPAPATPSPA
jgi:hypothetical protein